MNHLQNQIRKLIEWQGPHRLSSLFFVPLMYRGKMLYYALYLYNTIRCKLLSWVFLKILTFPFVSQTWNCPALTLSLVFSWLGKDEIVIFPAWKIQLKQVEEKQSEMIQASWNSVIVVGDGKSSGLDIRTGIDALFFNSLDQKFWSFIFGGLVKPHLWATQLESLSQ